MLSDFAPVPTLAVSDLQRAREFYEGVLGFTYEGDAVEGVMYKSGNGSFLVYPSAYAGTNKATAMSLQLSAEAFDAEVAALREKGVTFDEFEMDQITWDNGVASMPDGSRAAWFTDPDGNILNIEVGM
ncbi:MAG TPA: VOC family protein [Propionicimonas sp.]|jgi:catechol 2,3-dioxygenase-like lactoylglutathione lyase family enzyme